jgi:hypothetical protein
LLLSPPNEVFSVGLNGVSQDAALSLAAIEANRFAAEKTICGGD